jgi:hypothetical protein
LKNSFSTDEGKILGVIRREARSSAGGIHGRVDVAMKDVLSAYEAKPGQIS